MNRSRLSFTAANAAGLALRGERGAAGEALREHLHLGRGRRGGAALRRIAAVEEHHDRREARGTSPAGRRAPGTAAAIGRWPISGSLRGIRISDVAGPQLLHDRHRRQRVVALGRVAAHLGRRHVERRRSLRRRCPGRRTRPAVSVSVPCFLRMTRRLRDVLLNCRESASMSVPCVPQTPTCRKAGSRASRARSISCQAPPSASIQRWPYHAGASARAATGASSARLRKPSTRSTTMPALSSPVRGPNRISRACPPLPLAGAPPRSRRNAAKSTTL